MDSIMRQPRPSQQPQPKDTAADNVSPLKLRTYGGYSEDTQIRA
jgi:hypothetical protein